MLKLILLATGIAILLLLLTRSAEAKDDLPLEKHTYRDAHGKELPYRLLKPLHPEEGKKYPLVIFLHGAGERGSDNEKQLIHGVPHFVAKETQEKYPCFLVAPQCPAGQRWVEVDWSADSHTQPKAPGEAGRLTLELIEQVMKELPIDPKRVYLTGLSMGGYGTWDLLARRPELFAAAAPICGGADEATAAKIKAIPVWAFHGARDTAVKPARSRNMIAALEKAGGKPKYTEYPDVGHNSWDNAYKDPKFYEWMFGQKKE
ncbi:MAG TPA: prolyl oligopeptidase family serine peptidase [Gemmataceae bacterium]|nr:prolyl oligopeptidase family serine peptidase [Gemmataceae bacterium]